jgi:hypothetical protein
MTAANVHPMERQPARGAQARSLAAVKKVLRGG